MRWRLGRVWLDFLCLVRDHTTINPCPEIRRACWSCTRCGKGRHVYERSQVQ